jgi:CMP/dCMP kinase
MYIKQLSIVVAIDGPAASGKGTIAKLLSTKLNLPYLDTGTLYREVAFRAIQLSVDPNDEERLAQIAVGVKPGLINSLLIRTSRVSNIVPQISSSPKVRKALLRVQRDFASQSGGAILDGRDIGTVVFPKADVKLFVTASEPTRANRRLKELLTRGEKTTYEQVQKDIRNRDIADQNRVESPLTPASDAYVLDTSGLTIEEAVNKALRIINDKVNPAR